MVDTKDLFLAKIKKPKNLLKTVYSATEMQMILHKSWQAIVQAILFKVNNDVVFLVGAGNRNCS